MTAGGEPDHGLDGLLSYLKESRAFDFTGYKRASLARRIQLRMHMAGAEDYAAYIAVLEANPGEFAELFDTILINVTDFKRDPEAWDVLSAQVIPALAAAHRDDQPIRVWSAGCASGEEAYTLAVLLAEHLGEDRFRSMVKIYATDVDEAALTTARHARYPTAAVTEALGEERVHRFFETEGSTCVCRPDLRRGLIFGRHDLASDPPIPRVDLLSCRNTLMYFAAELQQRVLASFRFALVEGGFLFLGKSEAMVTRSPLLEVVDLKSRIFRRLPASATTKGPEVAAARPPASEPAAPESLQAAFESSPIAQLFVDHGGAVAAANRHARGLLGLGTDAIGRPLNDPRDSHRTVQLRPLVEEVLSQHRPVAVQDVPWNPPHGEVENLDILVTPVEGDGAGGVVVTLLQTGRYKELRDELERSQRELETTNEELQSTVEELETTNEELQSTNEELETTNEELQSTNEELETMNEELQATNEEFESANVELRARGVQLDELNHFLGSILASLHSGVAVLNTELAVRSWNRRAEDLWGLRPDEVEGLHFLNLDIGLPVDQLRAPIRACLTGASDGEEVTVSATNRRGRAVECRVTVSPLRTDDVVLGAIVVMDT